MILTGSSPDSNRDALALAKTNPGRFWSTAGMHPHHASDYDDIVHAAIQELLPEAEVVAVGECGLDYFRNFSPPQAQRDAFGAHTYRTVDDPDGPAVHSDWLA